MQPQPANIPPYTMWQDPNTPSVPVGFMNHGFSGSMGNLSETSSVVVRYNEEVTIPPQQLRTQAATEAPTGGDQMQRGNWGGQLEFILTCVATAVGLGNVWRFPYLCYKNGGGAFLVPYFIMLFTVGLPLFFLELAFGQFASLGPISIWSISPMFKGVGYGMVVVSAIVGIYYNVIVAQCLLYFFASLNSKLPWSTCNNWWNDPLTCTTRNATSGTMTTVAGNVSIGATTQYYNNYVLQKSDGFHDFGAPVWHLTLCLLLAWIVVLAALLKGVQSLGKSAYFTALFPYVILTILLVRSVMLPGSLDGIKFYLTPQFSRLADPTVWSQAATQIFFSLGVCNGGLIAMSSYNKFKNNCCRDAVLVANINCATSFYAGFVIFSNLGFMAHLKNTTVSNVVDGGTGLAFVVYPEALENLPVSPVWSVLFFLMMLTLGFGSEFTMVETLLSGFQDELRRVGLLSSPRRNIIYRVLVCAVMFLLGLPMVTRGGSFLLTLVDDALSGFPLLILALLEVIILCYFYGIRQLLNDLEMMTGSRPNWYWRITWCAVSPAIIVFLILFLLIKGKTDLTDGNYTFPPWTRTLSALLALFPLIFVPAVFFHRFCTEGGGLVFMELLKPKWKWGPADAQHRQEFLDIVRSRESFKTASRNLSHHSFYGSQSVNSGAITFGGSESNFFQNKMNVAHKLTLAASRGSGLNKLGSSPNLPSVIISADMIQQHATAEFFHPPPPTPLNGRNASPADSQWRLPTTDLKANGGDLTRC